MQINWLNWITSGEVHDVEHLNKFEQILEVLTITSMTSAVKFHKVWWACNRTKCHPVATDIERVVRVSSVQLKFTWACLDCFENHFRVESNSVIGYFCASFGEQVASFWQQEVHAVVRENPK